MQDSPNKSPAGFAGPTMLPPNSAEREVWQEANRAWWQDHPMRYDWKQEVGHPEFSAEFYSEIDRRFFQNAMEFMPWSEIPFDPLINFDRLADQDVLEIGVGNGSHAGLLAKHAKSFTGIDLTDYAVRSTTERLRHFGLSGTIERMDAERMAFPDNSFDFIWSWGVIHHSSDTREVLSEMRRVLRPGGQAVTMVYHRNLWNYYIVGGLVQGVLRGGLMKNKSLHGNIQNHTDGAIARYYSKSDWRLLVSEFMNVDQIKIYGSKLELLPIPSGRVKQAIAKAIPSSLARFCTNTLGMGSFLVSSLSAR
jgi:ubiquinone/menaquinone biosynthesis C-methylase UbiE